jgi:drug/metabolite transporter (DMT)-like permease
MTIPAWLSTARRTHLFWLANVAFWGAVFGAGLIVVKAFAPTLADPVSFVGCRALPGFVISSLLRWLSKHDDLRQRLGISQAGLMVGGPVAGGVLLTLILAAAGLDHERLTFKFQGLDQKLTGVENPKVVKAVFA